VKTTECDDYGGAMMEILYILQIRDRMLLSLVPQPLPPYPQDIRLSRLYFAIVSLAAKPPGRANRMIS